MNNEYNCISEVVACMIAVILSIAIIINIPIAKNTTDTQSQNNTVSENITATTTEETKTISENGVVSMPDKYEVYKTIYTVSHNTISNNIPATLVSAASIEKDSVEEDVEPLEEEEVVEESIIEEETISEEPTVLGDALVVSEDDKIQAIPSPEVEMPDIAPEDIVTYLYNIEDYYPIYSLADTSLISSLVTKEVGVSIRYNEALTCIGEVTTLEGYILVETANGDTGYLATKATSLEPLPTIRLTASKGSITGPSGKETYYNLPMGTIVSIMRNKGYTEEEYPYWVREDGAKMFGDYVMVAANLQIRPKGTIVETSLGLGIVVDTGGFAVNNPTQLDIATNW